MSNGPKPVDPQAALKRRLKIWTSTLEAARKFMDDPTEDHALMLRKVYDTACTKARAQAIKDLEKPPIVGSWVWIHSRIAIFKTDGTATQSDGLTKSLMHTGRWKEVKGVVEVEWDGTEIPIYYETVTLNGDVGKVFNKNFTLRFDIKRLGD